MKKSTLLLLCAFFGMSISIAAQTRLDSLLAVGNDTTQPDTTRLEAFHDIAYEIYGKLNPDSSYYFAQIGFELAKATGHKKWMGLALNTQGNTFKLRGDLDKALDYFSRSVTIYTEIGNVSDRSKSINNIGEIYQRKGDSDKALEYYLQALKINQDLNDKKIIGYILYNIGSLYYRKNDNAQALRYLNQSIKASKEGGNAPALASAQNAVGAIYMGTGDFPKALEAFTEVLQYYLKAGDRIGTAGVMANIGTIYMNQGEPEKALEKFKVALKTFEEIGILEGVSGVSQNIGKIYIEQGNYPRALEYLNISLKIGEKMGAKQRIGAIQSIIAHVYTLQGNHTAAISTGTQSLALCQETGALQSIVQSANVLATSYKATGQYRKALEMTELLFQIRDSIENQENQKAVIRQKVKSDYEKQKAIDDLENEKRVAIESEKKENQQKLSIAIGAGLLLISLLALVIFNRLNVTRRQKTIIEEQKKKVEQSEKYKEQFLANMSHEIRTPMHAISGMVKILERKAHPPTQDVFLKAIHTSADNLIVILNDVLDLSKIEAGKLDIESIPMQPAAVLENVMQILKYKAEEKGLALTSSIADDVPAVVMGDPTRLSQVLINLAGNAIKFSEKGSVDITLKNQDGQLLFSIKDTGIGIAADKLESIFNAFQQEKNSTARHYGGTGLGLSISKQLVELQQGKIRIESKEGIGSTFHVELPLVAAAAAISQDRLTEDRLKTMAASLKGIRILLAEDNAFNQMIAIDDLAFYIEDVKIDAVGNGTMAVEQFKTGQYDLILMDVQMPEMNGFEATRKIRELERSEGRTKSIPIIAMTASLLKSELDNCYKAGMNNYIPKPYEPEDLIGPVFKELIG